MKEKLKVIINKDYYQVDKVKEAVLKEFGDKYEIEFKIDRERYYIKFEIIVSDEIKNKRKEFEKEFQKGEMRIKINFEKYQIGDELKNLLKKEFGDIYQICFFTMPNYDNVEIYDETGHIFKDSDIKNKVLTLLSQFLNPKYVPIDKSLRKGEIRIEISPKKYEIDQAKKAIEKEFGDRFEIYFSPVPNASTDWTSTVYSGSGSFYKESYVNERIRALLKASLKSTDDEYSYSEEEGGY